MMCSMRHYLTDFVANVALHDVLARLKSVQNYV